MTEITLPRHAATLVLVREGGDEPRVLMGQRGSGAAFMPSKYVFPGGALDDGDRALAPGFSAREEDQARLLAHGDEAASPAALALAAIRETWEEAGLKLGRPDPHAAELAKTAPECWRGFFEAGLIPSTETLRFIFRAVTPPGRPRRFDARFFLANASHIHGDRDDLDEADGELAHLRWLTLKEARGLDLPFITEVVLAEVEARLNAPETIRPTPFFHHDDGKSWLDHL